MDYFSFLKRDYLVSNKLKNVINFVPLIIVGQNYYIIFFRRINEKMKYLKMVPFFLVMITILFLQLFQNQFQSIQEKLVLESNALLSSQHILAEETTYSYWESSQKLDDHFRIYGTLDDTTEQKIMAFYSTDYSSDQFPISEGLFFDKENSKQAIVGNNVQTTVNNGVEYFKYNNTNYQVIGKLGISDDSPLKNFIVINDSTLLSTPNIKLVFDGPDINKISWLKGKPMENKGVERWFNINFLSKWIKWTTIIVITFSSILASYFYTIVTKEARCAKFQIGISIKNILKADILLLTIIVLLMGMATIFIIKLYLLRLPILNILISYLILYTGLIVPHIMQSIYQITKERFE